MGDSGETVIDGRVEEGQLVNVPQKFVGALKAGSDGVERVLVKTKADAEVSPFRGNVPAIKALPTQVLMASYGISREEASLFQGKA
ncbi:hypothetical protein REPUB_Repub20aG0104700 [Reevesia pubescens]